MEHRLQPPPCQGDQKEKEAMCALPRFLCLVPHMGPSCWVSQKPQATPRLCRLLRTWVPAAQLLAPLWGQGPQNAPESTFRATGSSSLRGRGHILVMAGPVKGAESCQQPSSWEQALPALPAPLRPPWVSVPMLLALHYYGPDLAPGLQP